jgi:hypothetical protein
MVLAAAVWFFLMTSRMDVMWWRLVDAGCRAQVEEKGTHGEEEETAKDE